MKNNGRRGYIAITSAILITILVLVIVSALSIASLFLRNEISNSYYKEISRAAAESCVQKALFSLSGNAGYAGGDSYSVASATCSVVSVARNGSLLSIKTQSSFKDAFTVLNVTVNASSNFALVGLEETK